MQIYVLDPFRDNFCNKVTVGVFCLTSTGCYLIEVTKLHLANKSRIVACDFKGMRNRIGKQNLVFEKKDSFYHD